MSTSDKHDNTTPAPLGDAGPASTGYIDPRAKLGAATPQHVGAGADGIPPAQPKNIGGM